MSKFSKTMFSGMNRTRSVIAYATRHALLLNALSLALVVLVATAYIVQVNGSVAKGYAIRELEDRIKNVTLTNQALEVTVREAQSLDNVNRSVKMLGMVASDAPTYVSASAPSVALAR